MKTKKGSCWSAYYDPDTKRYFAEIIYTSREGREQYDYEITQAIYDRLGSFSDDYDNEAVIRTGKRAYSFENRTPARMRQGSGGSSAESRRKHW